MTPERWQAIQRTFHEALERPREERAAFVESAAGDDVELLSEVSSLLASADSGDEFLETPPAAPAEPARARIGPYDVVREIGHGGMGTVFLANRADEQFKKRVAIKVVRRGMDTESVLRRFRQERQILAGLEHPNIARLLDGGNTEDGLPYLVMEYVEGEPVTAWCERRALGLHERVALFRTICAAVQFAHQNLVVHRDLKPGNIFVTADGAPKLLDFGVAKLLNPEVTGQTLDLTGAAVRVFTPEYASPEQITGDRITTASDVYSLGVLLHEVLTGARPAAESGSTSKNLPADLATIVAMATRPEPERRYASVEQLSEDLRRWQEGLPVKARRDTLPYRAGRFLARHKPGVAAVALVFVSLVGGILATVRQTRIAKAEHERAERRLQDVRKLASSFLFEFHEAIRNLPGSTPARELIVRRALEYLGTLAKEAGGDRDLQRDLAEAYEKLAEVQGLHGGSGLGDSAGALSSMKAAVQIREQLVAAPAPSPRDRGLLARTLGSLGDSLVTTGDIGGALAAHRRAVHLFEEVVHEFPDDRDFRWGLATAHFSLSNSLRGPVDFEEKQREMRRALAAYESMLAGAPRDVRLRRSVALCHKYLASGFANKTFPSYDASAALAGYEKSMAIEKELLTEDPTNALYKRDLSHSLGGIGEALFGLGRPDEGVAAYGSAIALRTELAAADPKDMAIRETVARAYANLGYHLTAAGRPGDALVAFRRAEPIYDELIARDPSNAQLQHARALLMKNTGDAHVKLGAMSEARRAFDRSIEQYDRLRAAGRFVGAHEVFLREAIEARARSDAALAAKAKSPGRATP